MSDGGKGSAQRPTDHEAFSRNMDLIFGKKKVTDAINPDIQEVCQPRVQEPKEPTQFLLHGPRG